MIKRNQSDLLEKLKDRGYLLDLCRFIYNKDKKLFDALAKH
ncbi:MAG TPA: hypothetical protein VJG30_04990 [Candidatus Nanoarchaeia archaeon]|nr:hypothetical protein [Candidatus Nanoarchaeia archaeon]